MQPTFASDTRTQGIAKSWGQVQGIDASIGWQALLDRRNLIPLIVAASMVIPVNLIGTFRLGELLVLALYPFYMKQILKALRNRICRSRDNEAHSKAKCS
jgi:hypothetical protein